MYSKKITSLILAAVLSLSCVSSTYAAFGEGLQNNMHLLWENSSYNPHLKDIVVANDKAIVQINSGKLRGSIQNGIYQYLGVPYAEATERFVKAHPVKPWQGVMEATQYGAIAPQYLFGTAQPITDVATSNNNQNLNIWTSSLDKKAKKPVMVWFHGGGYVSGSGNEAWYNGENLAQKGDVVVVTVNHRLNVLGHLDLSAYDEKYKDSANVGSIDMVDALHWIHDNIEKFGGDPKNVTIFGESGGGSKVLELMAVPSAKGLFHKAIVESAVAKPTDGKFIPADISKEVTAKTLELLNITPDRIEELQTLPLEPLWKASDQALKLVAEKHKIPSPLGNGYGMQLRPVSGTAFLPTDFVQDNKFAASGKDIPLLLGCNLNEFTTIFPSILRKNMTKQQTQLYMQTYPDKAVEGAEYVDTAFRLSALELLNVKSAQGGAPVYNYLFTKQIGNDGAYHTSEIPFVFSNAQSDKKSQATMTALWSSFAHTGVPSAAGVPEWKPYTKENGNTMLLDDECKLLQHHDQALLQALAQTNNK